jgi:hypothetical protein
MEWNEKPFVYEFEFSFWLFSTTHEVTMKVEFTGKDALTDSREFVRSLFWNSNYWVDVSCTSIFSESDDGEMPRFPFTPFQFYDIMHDNEGNEV